MKKTNLSKVSPVCIFLSIIVTSCFYRRILEDDLTIQKGETTHILPLDIEIKKGTLSHAYSSGHLVPKEQALSAFNDKLWVKIDSRQPGCGLSNKIYHDGISKEYNVWDKDKRKYEAASIIKRGSNYCQINKKIEKKGKLTFEVIESHTKAIKRLWLVPSILSLGTLNVLGMPMYYFETELLLEAKIVDLSGRAIATYQGHGKAKTPVAYYYGYRGALSGDHSTYGHDASRITNIKAIKHAVKEIEKEIDADFSFIIQKLNNLGNTPD